MKKHMRIVWAILLLAAALANGTALANSEVIRLHVIANSDSIQDQSIKEQVRDSLVRELSPQLALMEQGDVEFWLNCNRDAIAEIAEEVLADTASDYSVRVEVGIANYPTRAYGGIAYPAGKYRSVRVILGSGQGRNWWCLLFPPLCFVDEAVEVSEDEQPKEVHDVKIKFYLVEKIRAALKRIWG